MHRDSDWKGYAARQRESKKNGKLRGRAVSFYIEFGGIFNDRMDMRFDPSGSLTIYGGTHSHGQGHATVFAQLAHEMPRRAVRADPLRAGRHRAGRDRPRHLWRAQRVVGGNALKLAADQMIEKGKKIAAAMMEADAGDLEFKDGKLSRHRHRQGDRARRRRQGDLRADGAADREIRHRPRIDRQLRSDAAEPSERLRMSASSRSTPRPARSTSTAITWSTISAASSTR